ncbi:MAG: V-type ATP synthase subunit I [Treponema sp.]|jgi:V/A-type H+-transporting ATPase subunit I|nr:V-type ATP synthase subunit I [Treponema sp.]
MKKVSLVVRDKARKEALTQLRKIGIVHLERKNAVSDDLSKAQERKVKVENAMGLILPYKVSKKKPEVSQWQDERDRRVNSMGRQGRRATDILGVEDLEPYSLDAVNAPVRPQLMDLLADIGKDRKALQDRLGFLAREYSRIEAWGEFDPALIKELSEQGICIFLYEMTPQAVAVISEDIRYIKLKENKNSVYLVVLDKEIPGIPPVVLPEKSLLTLRKEQEEIKTALQEIEKRLGAFADRQPVLAKELETVQEQIEFETALASMEQVDDIPVEYAFSYLSGFVPLDDVGSLKRAAAENGWALVIDDPEPDDEVPTKLKNNRLTELIYPLTNFLEVVPGYNEVDISGWFLLFFCIFFGMIFGDAGYGLFLFIIALVGIAKTVKKGVPGVLKMLLLLSVSNVIWGVLTCTWFGIETVKLPAFLRDISLPLISSVKAAESVEAKALVDQNLQIFCFSLALLQLGIAHLKGIIKYIRSLRVFAEIGSLGMLAGMYNLVLFLVASNDFRKIPLYEVSLYLLAGGFALNFIFASYEGNIGRSIAASFKNIISVVLGITNVFSDIMSYIRLWAVGLAGASIAATVNSMAGPLLGNFLVFLGIILLVFGHGLNVVLNVLSVLVHGVRLNTLEFSGHLGLTWSGTAYRPFAETAKK